MNVGDVRPLFGRRQGVKIRFQRGFRGSIVMLAEEIGVADRFVGKRALKPIAGGDEKKSGEGSKGGFEQGAHGWASAS